MKKIIIVTCCILSLLFLASCSFFNLDFQEDYDGFTDKLTERIYRDYVLTIPDSAVFLEGYRTKFKDPSTILVFTMPKEDLEILLSDKWKLEITEEEGKTMYHEYGISSGVVHAPEGIKFICQYIGDYDQGVSGYLSYSEAVDGIITVSFWGQNG